MSEITLVGGIDEVGRGALAGPIIAAITVFGFDDVIAMDRPPITGLADSKTFSTAKKREVVYDQLLDSPLLLDFGIGEASVEEINERGIDWCNNIIFQRAITCLRYVPHIIYVDGDKPIQGWPKERQLVEPKSDVKYWPVSAASIIAKVVRDRLMAEIDKRCKNYAFHSNAGYGSALHQMALKKYGPTEHHRTLFIEKIMRDANTPSPSP